MSCHMTLHEDVLDRISNILKQDDYYRALENLPVIDDLTVYDDIRLFPELCNTSDIIERITGEADLIKNATTMTGYVPPTYKFFTLHTYFCTQTYIHIRTYFSTTINRKSKHRIFTSKFTTLWTANTCKLN